MYRSDTARVWLRLRLLTTGAVTASAAAAAGIAAAETNPMREIRALKPIADTYVLSARPVTNFGRAPVLRVDGAPRATTYLRFRVPNKDEVATATLLLHTGGTKSASYEVRPVEERDWRERRLTFANAPEMS